MLEPAHIVGISKTAYVLATPRGPEWRRDLQRASTNSSPPYPLDRPLRLRLRGMSTAPQPRYGTATLHGRRRRRVVLGAGAGGHERLVGMKPGSDEAAGGCLMFRAVRPTESGNRLVLGQRGDNRLSAGRSRVATPAGAYRRHIENQIRAGNTPLP
jgi:hypothetical protein